MPDIDLSALSASMGFQIQGAAGGDTSGSSVSPAGDVNFDGVADIIIGAAKADPIVGGNTRTDAGICYVVFGRKTTNGVSPFANIALSSLTTGSSNGFSILGAVAGDQVGAYVSGGGDVNNDGVADVVVGAFVASPVVGGNARTNAGIAYVVFGRKASTGPASYSNIDLLTFTTGSTMGFSMIGAGAGDLCGIAVSLGDVNGDTISDIIVGARQADPVVSSVARADAGVSYVVFGRSLSAGTTSYTNIDLINFSTGNYLGYSIIGAVAGDMNGWSVSSAGDFNFDGIQDVMVSAMFADPVVSSVTRTDAGVSYVVFGRSVNSGTSAYTNIDLLNFNTAGTTAGFRIIGAAANDLSGAMVNTAGDINSDGVADVVIGAYGGDPTVGGNSRSNAGIAYVIFGRKLSSGPTSYANIDLASITTTGTAVGFAIYGASAGDQCGVSVSGAGDVNGDGVSDVIVGATTANPVVAGVTQNAAGTSYVVFGRSVSNSAYYANIDLATATGGSVLGFKITGAAANDNSGNFVGTAGDINGDGYSDILISAYAANSLAGITYVIQPTTQPTSQPSRQPSTQPSSQPSAQPNARPSSQPTRQPTSQPSAQPSRQPTAQPIAWPSAQPTQQPSMQPSTQPVSSPTSQPSQQPSRQPSSQPTLQPIAWPSAQPTQQPTTKPSSQPVTSPTSQPSGQPSVQPSQQPSRQPSSQPTLQPIAWPSAQPTQQPSSQPTYQPVSCPTSQPSALPTLQPSQQPSAQPSYQPTAQPSMQPASCPTSQPSDQPTVQPSQQPSRQPTGKPTVQPSTQPSNQPSSSPSVQPSDQPTTQPTQAPSDQPTFQPSAQPSVQFTELPSAQPTLKPSACPTGQPTSQPSQVPSAQPNCKPTAQPSVQPSPEPSSQPTELPSVLPSTAPTGQPSSQPTNQPFSGPTAQPSQQPSCQPSTRPSIQPVERQSAVPTMQPTDSHSSQPREMSTLSPSFIFSHTEKPSAQLSTRPTSQPSSSPSTQPSSQPMGEPSGQPTNQPFSNSSIKPSQQPSGQPGVQPSAQPVGHPTSQPSRQPSVPPSGQPTVEPSAHPTQLIRTAVVSPTVRLNVVAYIEANVWLCGTNMNSTSSSCILTDPKKGTFVTQYSIDWTNVMSVLTTNTVSTVVINGHLTDGTTITSEIATCSTIQSQLQCTVTSFYGANFLAASYVPYPNKIVYVGWYNVYTSISILDITTNTMQSYLYTAYNMKALTLSQVQSPPAFVGSFVAGTTIRATAAPVNYVVAGMLRTDGGVLSATVLSPVNGNILNNANLVNTMALEYTGPDSFIAGGLQLSDVLHMHAYLLRVNALYMTVYYCVRYRSITSGRRALSTTSVSSSVVRGMVRVDNTLFMILDHTYSNHTSLTVLQTSVVDGEITNQLHITAPNASLHCTGITTVNTDIAIVCSTYNSATLPISVLLYIKQDFTVSVLPLGFSQSMQSIFQTQTILFQRTKLIITKTNANIATTTSDFTSTDKGPTRRPSVTPSCTPPTQPTSVPSTQPSSSPTAEPTVSARPTSQPSSAVPTVTHRPTVSPTVSPTITPSITTTAHPSLCPSAQPTVRPTMLPSVQTTLQPSTTPTTTLTRLPSVKVTTTPSKRPTTVSQMPTFTPSNTGDNGSTDEKHKQSYVVVASVGAGVGVLLLWYVVYRYRQHVTAAKDREVRKEEWYRKQAVLAEQARAETAKFLQIEADKREARRLEKQNNRKHSKDMTRNQKGIVHRGSGAYVSEAVRTVQDNSTSSIVSYLLSGSFSDDSIVNMSISSLHSSSDMSSEEPNMNSAYNTQYYNTQHSTHSTYSGEGVHSELGVHSEVEEGSVDYSSETYSSEYSVDVDDFVDSDATSSVGSSEHSVNNSLDESSMHDVSSDSVVESE